jgi:hydroxyethylthiazole kinase
MMIEEISNALTKLRATKPIVLCLTNYVTMDFMANSLLALGASPIMSCDTEELGELIQICNAVNLNIGTLDNAFIQRAHTAVELAKRYNKPIILDPVGSGASRIRTESARALMPFADIIRGNASEIMSLSDILTQTAGVDSSKETEHAKKIAINLASMLNCTVTVSGKEDFITDGHHQESLTFGSQLMPYITGMGCTLTAVIAAFRAVITDSFKAAQLATAYFTLCGTLADARTKQPGTFRTTFIDELYAANFKKMVDL